MGSITCTLDGRSIACPRGRVALGHVATGTHTLDIHATDTAGNAGVTSYVWTVDRSKPDVLVQLGPARRSSDPDSRFNLWSSVDPGLFVCSLDGMPVMPCFGAPDFASLKDGTHTLKAWSVDLAGTLSNPVRYRWTIDTTPPQLRFIDAPKDLATTPSNDATFTIWQSEPSTLYCSLDGAAFARCSSPVNDLGLAAGEHTFQVYATDRVGNTSTTLTRTWTVA